MAGWSPTTIRAGPPFDDNEKPRTNQEQLTILLRNRADGADILEVGYRERGGATLDDHLPAPGGALTILPLALRLRRAQRIDLDR